MSDTTTTPSPTPRLSREILVEACVKIADAEGPEALTLRRLGAELGVDPTALYRHFRGKDELLTAVADRLLEEAMEGFRPTGVWREDLRALALRARRAYLTHPRLAYLVATAVTPLPTEQRLNEAVLGLLRSAGFEGERLANVFETLEAYVLAVSNLDAMAHDQDDERWRRSFASLPPTEYPNLTEVANDLYVDADRSFEFGLDLLLGAVESLAERRDRE